MKLKPEQRVAYPLARTRVLSYLLRHDRRDLVVANAIALAIWPDHEMTAQGAGAAASRILKRMEKEGLCVWTSDERNWGYVLTSTGRVAGGKL